MNRFCIITNENKDVDRSVTERVCRYLTEHGRSCRIRGTGEGADGELFCDEVPEDTECVISIGGDGTLIRAARDMAGRDVAFVGVNLGTVGFLTDVEPDSLEESLDRLLRGEYKVENRVMLDAAVTGQTKAPAPALNDVVISRMGPLCVIEYLIYVNDSFLTSFRADGVVVATPTGSTGYSLSAGGPIIEPGSRMMLITPICAHTLNARSIVLSAEDRLRIEARFGSPDSYAEVTMDGAEHIRLMSGDSVTVTVSDRTTRFVRMIKESFVTLLSRKLGGI